MINVCVVDDHRLVREGLKKYLAEDPGIIVTDEAKSGQELLEKVREKKYDVVLLDISMPGRNGLDILKQLKCIEPDINVLVLSIHPEKEYAERSLRAGASGYLTKNIGPDELASAIHVVANGKKYITPSLAERLADNIGGRTKGPRHANLSDREFEVMCMIASGKTVTQIADELSLSVKTISTHRTHILEKMKMTNNSELTYYAITNHLLD